ncbi:MAG: hypothetical protein NXH86_04215 [Flavobacteriaceae bacterium]|nr:hypothetical protein [Flavobacteriaceae bacterium]
MIYKSINNGKVFTTNNDGVIEVFTSDEMKNLRHEKWWQRKLRLIKEL